jgi:predicted tellurium resistance membrane protein TerC
MIEGFTNPANWAALLTGEGILVLLTLSLLEVILGIDNIIFISIVSSKLPKSEQARARYLGLTLALIMRVALLSIISWIAGLKEPIFSISTFEVSFRDLILLAGGLFLTYKTIVEIAEKVNGNEHDPEHSAATLTFRSAIIQIVLLDIVFSFDSILTAVAVSDNLIIMVIAVIAAVGTMIFFSGIISDFINRHPTVKMLALAFLVVIGVVLILDAFHVHIDKTYIYAAMGFSLGVELLNMRTRSMAAKKGKIKK